MQPNQVSKINSGKIGLFSAVFLGVSSIIGSGWLFAPFRASMVAGPASIVSWFIGAFFIALLALCYAEIASIFPKRGLSAIIPTLSHNKFFGFPFAIANWLGIVAVIGLEADATVEYLTNLFPSISDKLFYHGSLTFAGVSCSIVLVLFYCIVNFWGARLLAKTNNILTIVKIIVPLVTALIIISYVFHPHNFTVVHHSFFPYGYKAVLVALLTSGIIVAFNGFQTVVTFASEIKDPHKTIPRALILSLVISLVIYLLLQIAFVGGMPTAMLAHGWHKLSFHAPMVQLSLMLGFGMLASIIYFGATIAPTGAAIAFTGSATRMFTAMSRRDQAPKYFGNSHPLYRVSRRSLLMNTLLTIMFVVMFRSWASLAQVLTLFHVISYLPIPIALVVFRRRLAKSRYKFTVPVGHVIALFLFVACTYLMTLINTRILSELMIFFSVALTAFILLNINSLKGLWIALRKCYSLILYFLGVFGLCMISPDRLPGMSQPLYISIIVVFSVLTFYLMTRIDPDRRMPQRFTMPKKPDFLMSPQQSNLETCGHSDLK